MEKFVYGCFKCNDGFKDLQLLRNHLNNVHNLSTHSKHSCSQCKKSYTNRKELFSHLRKTNCGTKIVQHCVENRIEFEDIGNVCDDGRESEEDTQPLTTSKAENCEQFAEILKKQWLCLICNFCANKGMNRKLAFYVFSESKKVLFDPLIDFMATNFLVKDNNSDHKLFEELGDKINRNYTQFNTEYKLVNTLKFYNVYTDPLEQELDIVLENKRVGDQIETIENQVTIAVPNITFKLKIFLEIPGIFNMMTNYQNQIAVKEKIANITNGALWKSIIERENGNVKTIIPVLLYYDDFVVDNSISHKTSKTSIAGFYLIFPTLPPEYRSRVENILMVGVIRSSNIRKHGYGDCLELLIDEFSRLEEDGIMLNIDGKTINVCFYLLQVMGDNKGLNEILNFTRSFIGKRHCRLCSEEKSVMKKSCTENASLLRTKETYLRDLQEMNEKETGVRGKCPLDRLKIFKSYNNYVVDVHHDLLEGDCNFVICNILRYYIDNNLITIRRLEKIRKHFIAQSCGRNISDIEILYSHLENEKLHLNASEMKQFTLYLPIMLDHIITDKSTNHWKLLITLVEILEMCLWPEHDKDSLQKMRNLVQNHHELFILLFRDLRFKQHAMVHYATGIEQIGPLWNVCAMRGEAKHQALKRVAEATASRRNLPKTIIINDNYAFAAKSLNGANFERKLELGKSKIVSSELKTKLSQLTCELSINLSKLVEVRHLDLYGIMVKKNYVILAKVYDCENLYKILNIFFDGEENIFLCEKLTNYVYEKNLRCFVKTFQSDNGLTVQRLIHVGSLEYEPSLLIEMPSGNTAVKFFRKLEKH